MTQPQATGPLRVIQLAIDNIGRRSLIQARPDLELVGVYAHGEAADRCGWPGPTGVLATRDVESLLALGADACRYDPLWPSIDELCALLGAGVNVCTSAPGSPAASSPRPTGPGSSRRASAAAPRSSAAAPTRA